MSLDISCSLMEEFNEFMLSDVTSELKYFISSSDYRMGMKGALYFLYNTALQSIPLNQG